VNTERVALYAIFHDASEVLTGDLPTPVKYHNDQIRQAYKEFESHATEQLLKLLPDELRGDYRPLLHGPEKGSDEYVLVKAADTLCAYIKCLEELSAGNAEFSRAKKTIEDKVRGLCELPEVAYFVKSFVPGFSLTLDEISQPLER
jgi:5'-deoxynucleotidase